MNPEEIIPYTTGYYRVISRVTHPTLGQLEPGSIWFGTVYESAPNSVHLLIGGDDSPVNSAWLVKTDLTGGDVVPVGDGSYVPLAGDATVTALVQAGPCEECGYDCCTCTTEYDEAQPDSTGSETHVAPRVASDVRPEGTAGIKKDAGKARMDLLPPAALLGAARVFTFGADKYDKDADGNPTNNTYLNNWRQGMRWGRVYASLQRHLAAFWSGEDRDPETGMGHIDHALCNLMMLHEYGRTFPQGDDRDVAWRRSLRVAVDVDGVICDTYPAVLEKAKADLHGPEAEGEMPHYAFRQRLIDALSEITDEEYGTLPSLIDGREMPFEPVAYITARQGAHADATEKWLAHHGFPYAPVISATDKVAACREHKIDVFVEDQYATFVKLNRAGIACYLYDAPYNRKHDVGDRRIHSLAELVEKLAI